MQNLEEESFKKFYLEKSKAKILANKKGWKLKYRSSEGSMHELVRVSEEGKPIYYTTLNVDATVSTRTNFLHREGGLGLNVEGQEMIVHVWDSGIARATHQEYDGDGYE